MKFVMFALGLGGFQKQTKPGIKHKPSSLLAALWCWKTSAQVFVCCTFFEDLTAQGWQKALKSPTAELTEHRTSSMKQYQRVRTRGQLGNIFVWMAHDALQFLGVSILESVSLVPSGPSL